MKSRKIGGIILTILLFIAAIITIVPFVWMFISSFAPNSEIVKVTGGLFPKPSTIDNYVSIQEKFNFLRLFANSLIVAVLKPVLQSTQVRCLVTCSLKCDSVVATCFSASL